MMENPDVPCSSWDEKEIESVPGDVELELFRF